MKFTLFENSKSIKRGGKDFASLLFTAILNRFA